jgi:hypothetical protein
MMCTVTSCWLSSLVACHLMVPMVDGVPAVVNSHGSTGQYGESTSKIHLESLHFH